MWFSSDMIQRLIDNMSHDFTSDDGAEVVQAAPASWATITWGEDGSSQVSFETEVVENLDLDALAELPPGPLAEPLSITLYTDSGPRSATDWLEASREVTSFGYARREVSWSTGVVASWPAHSAHDCPDCAAMATSLAIPPGSLAVDPEAEYCTRNDDFGTEECDCSACVERRADVEKREAGWLEILSRETDVFGDPWAAAVNVFGASPPDAVSVSL